MRNIYLDSIETPEEISALHEMIATVWRGFYKRFMDKNLLDYQLRHYQSIEKIREDIQIKDTEYFFIVANSGERIGYLAYRFDHDYLYIKKFYLIPEVRGRGYGREVMSYLEDLTVKNGFEKIAVHIAQANAWVVRILEHFGFVITEKLETNLGHGHIMPEYVMELTI
ncbi:GNAT family N-acetyltransferase [Enterococcus hirae]|jgi:ribosomal protein S18 acetylase RimI-like enzyme|nr:GNAT family N-acetyltransferase [Enterococcaceae bacterium]MCI1919420.1 GNAT family N-acetyltransferase [Enterococcaceae bacterium]MDM8213597.1 GNAT family N-acetyltransferase [Enterococcus hirae]